MSREDAARSFGITEVEAAEAELEKLCASGVDFHEIMLATSAYYAFLAETGGAQMLPSVWLRDGHWKNWVRTEGEKSVSGKR